MDFTVNLLTRGWFSGFNRTPERDPSTFAHFRQFALPCRSYPVIEIALRHRQLFRCSGDRYPRRLDQLHCFRPILRRVDPLRCSFHFHPPDREITRSVGLLLFQPTSRHAGAIPSCRRQAAESWLIHHSERGSQYCAHGYQKILKQFGPLP